MSIPFSKYSGCGNDFILIDNRHLKLKADPRAIAFLCHRRHGIGADGVIFLESSPVTAFRMRIFNADGSEAEMCGNGLRCLAHYIHAHEITGNCFTIETMHHCVDAEIHGNLVTISMPTPLPGCYFNELPLDAQTLLLHTINTGVPHAVIFVDDLEHPKHMEIAKTIRYHSAFHPQGTNVNFAKIISGDTIAVRTYERGVEQETLACGTGATAVAIAAAAVHHMSSPITIKTLSGDHLTISFQGAPPHLTQLALTGPAIKVYEGALPCEGVLPVDFICTLGSHPLKSA